MVGSLPPETQKLWAASNALGRLAQASEIAEVILFLLSDKSSFVSAAVCINHQRTFVASRLHLGRSITLMLAEYEGALASGPHIATAYQNFFGT
jgi:NAD(P)-dependent dehydrogenase (short-subunit alcohol dehydrogenase family)